MNLTRHIPGFRLHVSEMLVGPPTNQYSARLVQAKNKETGRSYIVYGDATGLELITVRDPAGTVLAHMTWNRHDEDAASLRAHACLAATHYVGIAPDTAEQEVGAE